MLPNTREAENKFIAVIRERFGEKVITLDSINQLVIRRATRGDIEGGVYQKSFICFVNQLTIH